MDWEALVRRPEAARNGICIGSVSHLYAEPLLHGLAGRDGITLLRRPSEALTHEFASGACDAALLPVLGVLRKTRARVVPGMGVCVGGASGSERLLCRVPPSQVKSVSVQAGEILSGDLALILLAELYSARAELFIDAPEADAQVLFGDAGLASGEMGDPALDLGVLWNNLTGLPLVMAVWAIGDSVPTATLRTLLMQSFQSGIENLARIAEEGAVARGLNAVVGAAYLKKLHYRAGGEEMESMRTLAGLARKHGRCPVDTQLMFC